MVTEKQKQNYTKLILDLNARRSFYVPTKFDDGEEQEFLDKHGSINNYLAESIVKNESIGWVNLASRELLPYEDRTLRSVLQNEGISRDEISLLDINQYACPCCHVMTEIEFAYQGDRCGLEVIYGPDTQNLERIHPFTGNEVSFDDLMMYKGVDSRAKIRNLSKKIDL